MVKFLDFPGLRKRLAIEPSFGRKLIEMCGRLGLVPNYLLSVMSIETAGTFDPAIQNPINPDPLQRATGLIQFMPETARGLGTSIAALRGMTAVEQLQYVERFLEQNGRKIRPNVPGDYYMAIFMPAFVGAAEDKVLGRQGDTSLVAPRLTYAKVYEQNSGFDRSKRGFFTVGDVWQTTLGRIASAQSKPPIEVSVAAPLAPASDSPRPSLPQAWRSFGGPSDLPVLRIGAKGNSVALLQRLVGSDLVTGVYTEALANDYVRPLQLRHGLAADGVVGPLTWEALTPSLKPGKV
jgi:peptidoglycan hydrolase-like protein with peptidoglycan-binding domain